MFLWHNRKENRNFRSYSLFFFLVRAEFVPHIWMSGEIASLLLPFYCESLYYLQKTHCLTKHRTKKPLTTMTDRSSDKIMFECLVEKNGSQPFFDNAGLLSANIPQVLRFVPCSSPGDQFGAHRSPVWKTWSELVFMCTQVLMTCFCCDSLLMSSFGRLILRHSVCYRGGDLIFLSQH